MMLIIPMADNLYRFLLSLTVLPFFCDCQCLFKKTGIALHQCNLKIALLSSCFQEPPYLLQLPVMFFKLCFHIRQGSILCQFLTECTDLMIRCQCLHGKGTVLPVPYITFPAFKPGFQDIRGSIHILCQKLPFLIPDNAFFIRKTLICKSMQQSILIYTFLSVTCIFFQNQGSYICFTQNGTTPLTGTKQLQFIFFQQTDTSVIHNDYPLT